MVDERIVAALSGIAPVEPNTYTGEKAEYFTFDYFITPVAYADDVPMYDEYSIQVHYFCPEEADSLPRRAAARQALYDAGFTWPEEIDAGAAKSERGYDGYQHYVFECGAVESVELQ